MSNRGLLVTPFLLMKKESLVHGDSYSKERFSVRHEILVKKSLKVWFSTATTSFISPGPNRVRSLTT